MSLSLDRFADKHVTGRRLLLSPQSALLSLPTQPGVSFSPPRVNRLGPDFVWLHSAQSQSFIEILDVLVSLDPPLHVLFLLTTLSCCYLLFLGPFAIVKELLCFMFFPLGIWKAYRTRIIMVGWKFFPVWLNLGSWRKLSVVWEENGGPQGGESQSWGCTEAPGAGFLSPCLPGHVLRTTW